MKKHQRNLIIIFIVSSLVFLFNLDTLPVNIMEARNFVTAREMVEDGNWILTTMNGEARYEKPPLPTWLTAFSGMVGGIQNVTFLRIPAAICSIVLMLYLYFLNFRITQSKEFSLMATLVATTSYLIVFMGRQGTWDIFCHTFTIISIYYLFEGLQSKDKEWKNWMLGGVFLGLSILSKGPVSLYALFLPFLIAYGIVYRYQLKSKLPQLIIYIIIALLIGGSWYGYISIMDTHAANEISDKETTAWVNRNVKPFYRYFTFFVQSGIWVVPTLIGLLYPYLKDKVFSKKAYQLFFWWTILSVILLSLIPEKKERYLLPVMIPMATTTAFFFDCIIKEKFSLVKREHYIVQFIIGLVGIVAILLPIGIYIVSDSVNWIRFILLAIGSISIGIYLFMSLRRKDYSKSFFSIIGFMTLFAFLGMPLVLNFFPKNENYTSIENLKEEIKKQNLALFTYEFYSPELWFQYGQKMKVFDLQKEKEYPNHFLVLTSEKDSLKQNLNSLYLIDSIKSFDHNNFGEKANNYTHRLSYTLYKLNKKYSEINSE
ncbi:hypothetical protein UJ101_00142 [Flavobacteriaceae bacterium UJ101]|nr:hypothetical protein UJ101_00142 [Flavobacteriaceae bacterium UJ101]